MTKSATVPCGFPALKSRPARPCRAQQCLLASPCRVSCVPRPWHRRAGPGHRPWASTTTSSWVKRNEGRFHRKRVPLDLVGAHPVVPGNVPGKRLRPIWSLPVRDKGQRPHHPRSKRPPQTRLSVHFSSATARRCRRSRSARTRRIPSVLTPWARRSTVINWCQYQAGHSRSR